MTFLLELLSEFVFVIVFQYPGALIRWLIAGRKRTFKEVLSDPFYWNVSVTVLLVGIIFFFSGSMCKRDKRVQMGSSQNIIQH